MMKATRVSVILQYARVYELFAMDSSRNMMNKMPLKMLG